MGRCSQSRVRSPVPSKNLRIVKQWVCLSPISSPSSNSHPTRGKLPLTRESSRHSSLALLSTSYVLRETELDLISVLLEDTSGLPLPNSGRSKDGKSPDCMNTKQKKVLEAIFEEPVRANIVWRDVEALLKSLGAEITEGRGSRVRVGLNERTAVLHEPHPEKEMKKAAVRYLRGFLSEAGVQLDE
jgi:hypothetical protein